MRHPRQNLCEESQDAHEGGSPSAFVRSGIDKEIQEARRKEAACLYHAKSLCVSPQKWDRNEEMV